jgi:asparaginyl-tRNA synthetase
MLGEVQHKAVIQGGREHYGKEIEVAGWVRTIRDSKTFGFIELNDGSFFRNLQIVSKRMSSTISRR